MKKLIFMALPFLFAMCQSPKTDVNQVQTENDSLQRLVIEKDSAIYAFLGTFNEIEMNLQEIKSKEGIISMSVSEDGTEKSREDKINEEIQYIYDLMLENKQKVAQLEKQLKRANIKNSELQQTIINLQAKLQEKDVEILQLREELKNMNIKVDELSYAIDTLKFENQAKDEVIKTQDENLNTAYYLIGSSKELKEHQIIDKKGGFIGSKKLNKDFDKSFFTKVDIRNVTSFDLNVPKIKILTTHPSNSYKIIGEKPVEKLEITNPDEFWSVSKYLVIIID